MSNLKNIREAEVYQYARNLIRDIYALTKQSHWKQEYSLKDQIQRSSVSILSNIAEGYERDGTAELIQFLSIAKGSTGEVMAQLDVSLDVGLIEPRNYEQLTQQAASISKQLGGWIQYLRKSEYRGSKFKQHPESKIRNQKSSRTRSARSGFAIIATLLVLTVLTVMVIAFLQSMRIERLTARAYLYKTQADLMAQAAAEEAIHKILKGATNPSTSLADLAYTVENGHPDSGSSTTYASYSPVLFVSRYEDDGSGNLTRKPIPLISTDMDDNLFETDYANSLTDLFDSRSNSGDYANLNSKESIQSINSLTSTGLTAVNALNYYRTPLVDLKDASNNPVGRYGYLVTDEQARLNPTLHRSAMRNDGTSSGEIALSLANDILLTAGELAKYISSPTPPGTAYALGQFFSDTDRATDRKHLIGFYSASNQDVIPAGYTDAGKPKYNINDLATNASYGATATERAENIGTIIDNNLPNFKLRDPSFAESGVSTGSIKYNNRIAASIVDYIDTDNDPTAVNGGEPAGKDLTPLVCGIAENFKWTSKGSSPNYVCTFESQYYLQIWNPYTTTITGSVRLEVLERPTLQVGNALESNLKDYDQSVTNITIRPNEFIVVELPSASEDPYTSNTDPDSPITNRPKWNQTSSTNILSEPHPYFKMYWNGVLTDMNRRDSVIAESPATSGLPKAAISTTTSNTNRPKIGSNRWSVHFMQLPTISSDGYRRYPDPRINYISNYDWTEWVNSSYTTNANWGGRQTHTSTNQDFEGTLLARDVFRKNPNAGSTASSISETPLTVASTSTYDPATDGLNAPFYIRNDAMTSIAELGNIFDPAQASDNGKASPSSANVGAFGSGGGRSLRIGQPEFSYMTATLNWDVEGKRAMQLIDLFTTNATPSGSSYPEMPGRININTAPKEVLEALFYNIYILSDEGAYGGTAADASRIDVDKALALANSIVTERTNNGYFRRLSDLYRISNFWNTPSAYQPALGSATASGAPAVMDRAREELFSKTVNLIDTQSRAFRIFSTGQALNPLGNVAARSYKETIVQLEAGQDSSGNPTLTPRIIYERYY